MASHLSTAARTRRMLALLPHLHQGDTLSLAWLASLTGSSADDVAGDLWTLMLCGVPPFDPGSLIDLAIDEDTVTVITEPQGLTQPVRFTHAECRALTVALGEAGYKSDSPLLVKLLDSASPSASTDELHRTLLAATAPGGTGDIFAILAGAIDGQEKVRITYHTGSTGRTSERIIHPHKLSSRYGISYVTAFCEQAGDGRVFRLDRIREAVATGEQFKRPADVPCDTAPNTATLPTARIRFSPGITLPDEDDWPGIVIESREKNASGNPETTGTEKSCSQRTHPAGTIVRVPYQEPLWLARRVAAYLGNAEVLEPVEVRETVREIAEEVLRDLAGQHDTE